MSSFSEQNVELKWKEADLISKWDDNILDIVYAQFWQELHQLKGMLIKTALKLLST